MSLPPHAPPPRFRAPAVRVVCRRRRDHFCSRCSCLPCGVNPPVPTPPSNRSRHPAWQTPAVGGPIAFAGRRAGPCRVSPAPWSSPLTVSQIFSTRLERGAACRRVLEHRRHRVQRTHRRQAWPGSRQRTDPRPCPPVSTLHRPCTSQPVAEVPPCFRLQDRAPSRRTAGRLVRAPARSSARSSRSAWPSRSRRSSILSDSQSRADSYSHRSG